jgi:type I restriction enzyme R subunit
LPTIDPQNILDAEDFDKLRLLDDARDAVVQSEESKKTFLALSTNAAKLYKAILPDPAGAEFGRLLKLFSAIVASIRNLDPEVDISEVMDDVTRILDESITARSFVIPDREDEEPVDLSKVNFEELKKRFEQGRRHTEADRLRGRLNSKVKEMVRLNRTRTDYQERLQRLIDNYNSGSLNVDLFFNELMRMAQDLTEEERRSICEGLTEEELAVFDLLIKPEISLTEKEKDEVKGISRDLLSTLKKEKLVLDWRKRQQARASVRVAVEEEGQVSDLL